jgi:tRNA-dihydrouridine synthase
MISETGVDAVMVGRAAIGNPWFFSQALEYLHGSKPPSLIDADIQKRDILEHLARLITHRAAEQRTRRRGGRTSEETAVLQFRAHLCGYLRGRRGWAKVRRDLDGMRTMEHITTALDSVEL